MKLNKTMLLIRKHLHLREGLPLREHLRLVWHLPLRLAALQLLQFKE
jgi:hypothetical protein